MHLRIVLIEPEECIRESLGMFLKSLGHEVLLAAEPTLCPIYSDPHCSCPQDHPCGDVLLVGQHLPRMFGFDFIEKRIHAGCKGLVQNMAVLCGPWQTDVAAEARALGCQVFTQPLDLQELAGWIDEVAARTSPDRVLAALPS